MLERSLVTVVTPALAQALVPVATVRTELGLDTSSDAKIERLIGAMGAEFAGMNGLQRPLVRQTYLERLRLHDLQTPVDGHLLDLARWPIESVTSVTDATDVPATVTASEYEIALERRSALYRDLGWSCDWDYLVTYIAGWIPPGTGPGLILPWSVATAKVVNQWVKPLAAANGSNRLLFRCSVAGTTHTTTEPTWPTTAGGTVVDQGVTWTAHAASELPYDIQEAAIVTVSQWMRSGVATPFGVQSVAAGDFEIAYDFVGARAGFTLPPYAKQILGSYR